MTRSLFVALCVLTLGGCETPQGDKRPVEQSVAGTVVAKEWSKSEDSWDAGGSTYYMLILDRPMTLVEPQGTHEELLLLPTDSVPQSRIAEFVGRRAQCSVIFEPGKPYIPEEGSLEQQPAVEADPFTGKPLYPTRGTGFKVTAIK